MEARSWRKGPLVAMADLDGVFAAVVAAAEGLPGFFGAGSLAGVLAAAADARPRRGGGDRVGERRRGEGTWTGSSPPRWRRPRARACPEPRRTRRHRGPRTTRWARWRSSSCSGGAAASRVGAARRRGSGRAWSGRAGGGHRRRGSGRAATRWRRTRTGTTEAAGRSAAAAKRQSASPTLPSERKCFGRRNVADSVHTRRQRAQRRRFWLACGVPASVTGRGGRGGDNEPRGLLRSERGGVVWHRGASAAAAIPASRERGRRGGGVVRAVLR